MRGSRVGACIWEDEPGNVARVGQYLVAKEGLYDLNQRFMVGQSMKIAKTLYLSVEFFPALIITFQKTQARFGDTKLAKNKNISYAARADDWFSKATAHVDEHHIDAPTHAEIKEAAHEHSGAPLAIWIGILGRHS